MDYKTSVEVGNLILRLIAYVILLTVAASVWTVARGQVGILIGHDVSCVSFFDMVLILAFARIVYRLVVHGGADEISKRGKKSAA